jgi:hypothetical protein
MHYKQFRAEHRFVCAGHNETARQKISLHPLHSMPASRFSTFFDAEPLIVNVYANQNFAVSLL